MADIKDYEPLWGSWYVDGEPIGEGAFGKVYKVHKEEFGSIYYAAVKMMSIPQSRAALEQARSEGLDDASVKSYFQAFVTDIIQEIDLMSAFKGNTNIVSLEDHKVVEHTDGIGWDILIRMELLQTLSSYVNTKPLNPDDVIQLGMDISRALELCAARKIIHRDIKPDNIFVSQYGDYKLGDFGIARHIEHTMSGLSKKGTYTYMAPEVFKGEDYGPSVDLYSLGIVMYRYLNKNRTPFLPDFPAPITPNDRSIAMERRMKGEKLPDIPDIDPELNALVLKACAYKREDRFKDAEEFRVALEKFSGSESKPPILIETQPEPSKNERRKKKVLRQEKDGMTTGVFKLRRNEPEESRESESKPTVPPKIMNTFAIIAAVCCGMLAILSLFSGNKSDIFVSMPLYILCVAVSFLNFRHSASNTVLLVWLIAYLSVSGLNFSSFDYVLMSFASGLLAVESMRSRGKKFMYILSITLFISALTYSVLLFITMGESNQISFRLFMLSKFGIPFMMILSSCFLLLPQSKRGITLAGFMGLQLFSLTAFVMMIFSAFSSNPSQVIFNVANSCFVGFTPERFSWWRYARFTGLIVQTLAVESMLCVASAGMIPSDFLELIASKKKIITVMLICVLIMASFLYFLALI